MRPIKKRISDLLYSFFLEITKICKFSYIIGSKTTFFSFTQILFPLSGLFSGVISSSFIFCIRTLILLISSKLPLHLISVYHIPTFCGAVYLGTNNKFIKIVIPAICMFLFITDPIGKQAFLFSFYWFIPIIIALFPNSSIFIQTIGSTFTTHAVGSIIWLYTKNLDALTWNSLISVVWAERLIFAIAMTGVYYTIQFITSKLKIMNEIKLKITSYNY